MLAVKPFNKADLHWTAGLDEFELVAFTLGPIGDRYAGDGLDEKSDGGMGDRREWIPR